MQHLARACCVIALSAGFFLHSGPARADAVPPPPKSCPKGQVGITDHGGPRCVPEAPKNCAPGYRGQVGGKCVLANCGTDEQCEKGQRCMRVDTCQEFRELHWTGWGWSAARPVPRDNFLAGPPRPRPDGPPKKAWVELNICGQDGPCKSPAECRPSSLCYPTSQIGKTKAKVTERGSTDPPAEAAGGAAASTQDAKRAAASGGSESVSDPAPSPAVPQKDTDTPASDAGGCRKGCTATSSASALGWVGIPLWAVVFLFRRRRLVST
jgi:hypothetical protein